MLNWPDADAVTVAVVEILTLGGVQVAFAEALALQLPEQFALAMQPPSSEPPLQVSGVGITLQLPEHCTDA